MDSIAINGTYGFQKLTWVLSEGRLTIRDKSGRSEKVIPLSQIKGVNFTYAAWGVGGHIDINIGAPPSTFIRLSESMTISDSGVETLTFSKDSTKNAELMRDYINNYLSAPPAPSGPAEGSLTDELTKLKSLQDSGILTQEEFDAAKKKLLGL